MFALFAVAAGTNVPTPLLLVYQERLGLSAEVLTALFGCYAAGLVPALLLAGQLSDRLGRRRVAIPGIVLSGLASLAFAAAGDSLSLLFTARFLQGVVSGVVFSVGSAWVSELSAASGEGAGGRRAAFAMTAGFALGPLTSGLLGEFGPAPTVLPYLVHTALVAVGLGFALGLPETVDLHAVHRSRGRARRQVPLIQPGDGLLVATVLAPVAVCVYAFPSSVISAVPLLVDLPYGGVAVTGLLAGVTLGAGTLVAPLQRPPRPVDGGRRGRTRHGRLRGRGGLRDHRLAPLARRHRTPAGVRRRPLPGRRPHAHRPAGGPDAPRRADRAVPRRARISASPSRSSWRWARGRRPRRCRWRWRRCSPDCSSSACCRSPGAAGSRPRSATAPPPEGRGRRRASGDGVSRRSSPRTRPRRPRPGPWRHPARRPAGARSSPGSATCRSRSPGSGRRGRRCRPPPGR